LIAYQIPPPKAHNINILIDLLPATLLKPSILIEAATLSNYAVDTRYPGEAAPMTEDEYLNALQIADATLQWAESILAQMTGENETGT